MYKLAHTGRGKGSNELWGKQGGQGGLRGVLTHTDNDI